jgi:ribonuclease P protein component
MLAAKNRVPLRALKDFFETTKRLHTFHLVIYFIGNDTSSGRGTVIVPAKRVKLAVQRNKLKRQLRAALAQTLPDFNNNDLVLYLKKVPKKSKVSNVAVFTKELKSAAARFDRH